MRHNIVIDPSKIEFELLAAIDREAEGVRGLFITNTPSQPSVYLAKEAEALALMSNLDLPEGETPNLTREAARLGQSRYDCAVVVLTQAHMWRQVSAIIEDIRLTAKDAVRAAETVTAKRAAAAIDWSAVTSLA